MSAASRRPVPRRSSAADDSNRRTKMLMNEDRSPRRGHASPSSEAHTAARRGSRAGSRADSHGTCPRRRFLHGQVHDEPLSPCESKALASPVRGLPRSRPRRSDAGDWTGSKSGPPERRPSRSLRSSRASPRRAADHLEGSVDPRGLASSHGLDGGQRVALDDGAARWPCLSIASGRRPFEYRHGERRVEVEAPVEERDRAS